MANILVAGGMGYVGSRLYPALIERGHAVDVVDLCWFGKHYGGMVLIEGNVLDLSVNLLRGYDAVIFLAGLSNDPMANFAPGQNFIYNAAAPAYLAYAAKQAGVKRFVYASSCSVYGIQDELSTEESPISCQYPYGLSKLQGERAVLQLQDRDFSVIALRKGTVSGHSPRMRFDLIVNTMFRAALIDRRIIIHNADIWRPILGIRDAVRAYIAAIGSDYSGVYNIASFNKTVGHIAEDVKSFVGSSVQIETHKIPDVRNYRVSVEKAMGDLCYFAQESTLSILQDLADNNSIALDSPNCYNVKVLKESITL